MVIIHFYIQIFNGVSKEIIKVGLSPFKNFAFIYVNGSPLKIMKNSFYFTFKALFVQEIFTFLSRVFGYIEKESAKLRPLRANVSTFLAYLRDHVPEYFACLRAHVQTCFACPRAHVLTCRACLRAHMPTFLACLRAPVTKFFACLRAHVSTCLACLRAHVLMC